MLSAPCLRFDVMAGALPALCQFLSRAAKAMQILKDSVGAFGDTKRVTLPRLKRRDELSTELLNLSDEIEILKRDISKMEVESTDDNNLLRDLLTEFGRKNGGIAYRQPYELAIAQFIDSLHQQLAIPDTRTLETISSFYCEKCQLVLEGGPHKFVDRASACQAFQNMYDSCAISIVVDKLMLDNDPPKRCDAFVSCIVKLTIDKDAPRKVQQIFELHECNDPEKRDFQCSKHIMITLDSRPLYHYPEAAVPVTHRDNWEAQFKPVPTADELAAIATAQQAALDSEAALLAKAQGKDAGDEDEDEEEDEEEDEASKSAASPTKPSTAVSTAPPNNLQSTLEMLAAEGAETDAVQQAQQVEADDVSKLAESLGSPSPGDGDGSVTGRGQGGEVGGGAQSVANSATVDADAPALQQDNSAQDNP